MAPRKRPNNNKSEPKVVHNTKRSKTDENDVEIVTNRKYSLRKRKSVKAIKEQIPNKVVIKKSKYFSDDNIVNSDDEPCNEDKSLKRDAKLTKINANNGNSDSDSDSKDDWEEVMDNPVSPDVDLNDYHPELPKEGVDITIDDPLLRKKKAKKKSFDVNEYIRLRVNKFKKDLQLNRHKTSLLLLMARGLYLNKLTTDQMVRALSMSFVVNQTFTPLKAKPKLKFINEFVVWFKQNFRLEKLCTEVLNINARDIVCECLTNGVTSSLFGYVLSFISLLRAIDINMNVRLCYALNAVDLFADDLILTENQSKKIKKPVVIKKNGNSSTEHQSPNKKVKSKSKSKTIIPEVEEVSIKQNFVEYWTEIFLESEKRWICCDIVDSVIDKPHKIAKNASILLTYVLAFDSDHYIKEVTARYSNDWMTKDMKKRRVNHDWWLQCLSPFSANPNSFHEKLEEEEFESFLSEKPLPQKVGDYKNHPLYVLKKDLLKYQGIYPSDAPPLGFFKEQPVYARECVFTLRGMEAWKRFAKVVKKGESPYKMVTSRPKWDRYSKSWKRDLPLELYGEWQTEDYIPPKAENGIVPRNSYGNVELFQTCMLPVGTVYLQLPGLLRIASKLKIDCAPAVVGFDNNLGGCGSHPTIDGFVVCEEFKDILIDAWEEEQENARQRELQRREKRVYDNWKKLIKGLLIREKLKLKYNTEQRT